MTDEISPSSDKKMQLQIHNNSAEAVYGLGLIGAWIYYFSRAHTTEERVRAFFKGLVWPAVLVKELLTFLDQG